MALRGANMSEDAIVVSRVLSSLIAMFSGLVIITNYIQMIRRYRAKTKEELEKLGVIAPFVGGLCGVWAFYWSQSPMLWRFWWIPLVIDPGSIPMIIYLSVINIRDVKNRHNTL
jgi:hypothetical protein